MTPVPTTTPRGMQSRGPLDEPPLPVQAKLAAAWTTFLFLYLYVDHLALYEPGNVQDILNGIVHVFPISQTFVVTALAVLSLPIFMIVLSAILPARANQLANLVAASLLIPFTIFNVTGSPWVYFYGLGVVLELIVQVIILRLAWTWPRRTASPTAGQDAEALGLQPQA